MIENLVVLSKINEHIAQITLNRSQVLNALNQDLLLQLAKICDELSHDSSTRAVVLTGAGNAFCAGADLKERKEMTLNQTLEFVELIRNTFTRVSELPMPTIAAIHGVAFGGGLELALACDMRVLAKNAQIGLTECALGILPGAGGTQRLPRLVGIGRAKEMILTAKRMDATQAYQFGLVNELAEDIQETLEKAVLLAKQAARCAPLSVRAAKVAIDEGFSEEIHDGLALELRAYESILYTEDRVEGLKAFSERREPTYKGK